MSLSLGASCVVFVSSLSLSVCLCSGGPAGCVVAGRLAYADPDLKVMLIEGQYIAGRGVA